MIFVFVYKLIIYAKTFWRFFDFFLQFCLISNFILWFDICIYNIKALHSVSQLESPNGYYYVYILYARKKGFSWIKLVTEAINGLFVCVFIHQAMCVSVCCPYVLCHRVSAVHVSVCMFVSLLTVSRRWLAGACLAH